MTSPLSMITRLQDMFGRYPESSGGCLKFFLFLFEMYPHAKGLYNGDHIITKIDNCFYDVDGTAPPSFFPNCNFIPVEEFGLEHFLSSFEEHLSDQEIVSLHNYFNRPRVSYLETYTTDKIMYEPDNNTYKPG